MKSDERLRPRKHQKDLFHAFMVEGAHFEGAFDIPKMQPTTTVPKGLVPFSAAMSHRCEAYDSFVHFYEDDCKIERFWNHPQRYIDRLRRFAGVISPDYSTCVDFPGAIKLWNTYRNMASGHWLQSKGIDAMCNVRTGADALPWSLDGVPRNSVIAISTRACVKNRNDRRRFIRDIRIAVDKLAPTGIVVYGTDGYGVLDYPRSLGIPVYVFPSLGRGTVGW